MAKPVIIHEIFDDIIKDIAMGFSVVKACGNHKTSSNSFYDYIETDPKLKLQYTRAREDRGDSCSDNIEKYQQMLINGEIDSSTARVLIDTEKWKACKFYPKMFGEKQTIEHQGNLSVKKVFITKDDVKKAQEHIKDVIED